MDVNVKYLILRNNSQLIKIHMENLKSFEVKINWLTKSETWDVTARTVRATSAAFALEIVIAWAEMEETFSQLVSAEVVELA